MASEKRTSEQVIVSRQASLVALGLALRPTYRDLSRDSIYDMYCTDLKMITRDSWNARFGIRP